MNMQVNTNQQTLSTNTFFNWHDERSLNELKLMYGKGLSDIEWLTFLGVGRATCLNPIKREIWAYKFGNAPATIFIGRDGYRISAVRNPNYLSHRVEAVYEKDVFVINEDGTYKHEYSSTNAFVGRGELVGAYCIIKFKNHIDTTQVMVSAKEYNKKQSTWNTIPDTMLKKVAEAQALRMAFPEQFNGTYHEYEIDITSQTQKLNNILDSRTSNNATNNASNTTHAKQVIQTTHTTVDAQTGEVFSGLAESINAEDGISSKVSETRSINIDQLTGIRDLMLEKKFNTERKAKAMEYFAVTALEQLNFEQANEFLTQLEKI